MIFYMFSMINIIPNFHDSKLWNNIKNESIHDSFETFFSFYISILPMMIIMLIKNIFCLSIGNLLIFQLEINIYSGLGLVTSFNW
jgi:hypothetical protein